MVKRNKSIGIILILLFGLVPPKQTFAQSSDSLELQKKKIGDFFNPGLSLGYGEGHLTRPIPSMAVRMGRFHLKGMFTTSFNDATVQLQYDAIRLPNRHPKRSTYLTLSGGITERWVSNWIWPLEPILVRVHSYGTGFSYNWNNNRSRFSANVSITNSPLSLMEVRYFIGRTRSIYGQVSYSHYLFKSTTQNGNLETYSKFHRSRTNTFFSKWFNPFASIGLGTDRVGYMPAYGLKVGPVNAKFSFDEEFVMAFNINADVIRFNPTEKYNRHYGFGATYITDYGYSMFGITGNYTLYKINGRNSFDFKLGIGKSSFGGTIDKLPERILMIPNSDNLLINGGVSFNMYLFRFVD